MYLYYYNRVTGETAWQLPPSAIAKRKKHNHLQDQRLLAATSKSNGQVSSLRPVVK
jgi:hypothetical protein